MSVSPLVASPRCRLCVHPERTEADRALLSGEPERSVARRFGCAPASVHRHASNHLLPAVARARDAVRLLPPVEEAVAREAAHGDDLLGQLRDAAASARRLADRAEREGDLRGAIAGVKTLSDVIATLATVAGKLAEVRRGDEESAVERLPLRLVIDGEDDDDGEAG